LDRWRLNAYQLTIPRKLKDDFPGPDVLFFQCLQPTHLARQQATIPLLPAEVGRLDDPRLSANLGHRRTFITLLQEKRLLRLREP
jgi:hypothetical protein